MFAHKLLHRAIAHGHEIAVALIVEGSRVNVFILLLIVAAICIALAVQVAVGISEA